ncbi:unnamed protein product [Rhizoctonia solani]|uniref:Uncharacterized protein n=1 Tax=Rhizoctonia solani TaxID=456999 RepID=A0A8H3BTV1_9AGAM|nr:unnamed protein product [Rhizoctonia solani]
MSAAPSFPPPFVQLPVRGEHLSVHTKMDGIHSHQSLPSAEESIDEVQLGLDAQTDELSMEDDRAQVDELEEDPNEGLQYPPDLLSSEEQVNDEHVNGQLELAQAAQPAGQPSGQDDVTSSAPDEAVSIEESTEEPPQTDLITNSLVAETDAILQAEMHGATTATENTGFASLEGQEGLEMPEGENFEFPVSVSEQEISSLARDFAREVEEMSTDPSEHQSNEQDLDLQTVNSESVVAPEPAVDSHEDAGAPPLRRMDEETIPVTAHSKESIIDVLNDAVGTTADESIQLATTAEQILQESEPVPSTEVVPEQVDMEMDARDDVQPEEPATTLAQAHVEHTQVLEPNKEGGGEDADMEQGWVVVEQDGEPSIDTTTEASIDHQSIQIVQEESTSVAQDEPAMSDPMPDDTVTASGDAAGPIITVIEQSTTIAEQTSVELTEQTEPSTVDPAAMATMDTTTTSIATTTAPADPAVADSVISTTGAGDMDPDHIERAAQIHREQDATAQATQDETQTTLPEESVATANNTIVTDDISDPTAPKDSDSPERRVPSQSQSQSQSQLDPVVPQTVAPIDPLVTQNGDTDIPDESSEPTKPQYQVSTDLPEITPGAEPLNRQTAPLDEEDAHGSAEPEPSSEPSEYPDVVTEDPPVNTTGISTDKATEPSNSSTPAPARKKKPRMIMEVVIPIASRKPKVVQETKTTKKRPRGRPIKAKSAKAPAPTKTESPAVSSSPQRSSSTRTPSPVKSESSEPELEPEPRVQRSGGKRTRTFGSRKRTRKAVASGSGTRSVHVAHTAKLEVVIPRRPRPSVLKGVGSTPSGNNVKFAPAPSVTGKRKAESEPEVDDGDTDADADGETDDEYEDVEESKAQVEVLISPKPRKKQNTTNKAKISPIKRPRRSSEARKIPTKIPETISKARRPSPKRRRLRR